MTPPLDTGTDPRPAEHDELLQLAWGVIANAGRGDWSKEHPDWQGAAEGWRDRYHEYLDGRATR